MASEDPSPGNAPSWGLVLVRIVCGWTLLLAGWSKVTGGVGEDLVLGTRGAFAAAPSIVRWWGEHVVLPHPLLFAHLIAWGEFLGGVALFLGALVRPFGIVLAFMFANFYFAGPDQARNIVLLYGAACLGCAISRAGRSVGADVFLDPTLPRWIRW